MEKQRLDKWLFFSRAAKSRTLAQRVIEAGEVRVNSERTSRSDFRVGVGDVLTMTMHGQLRVWRIRDAGERRGPATEAQALYEDISPPPVPRAEQSPFEAAIAQRAPGAGRPTKKQRRDIDRLLDDPDG